MRELVRVGLYGFFVYGEDLGFYFGYYGKLSWRSMSSREYI